MLVLLLHRGSGCSHASKWIRLPQHGRNTEQQPHRHTESSEVIYQESAPESGVSDPKQAESEDIVHPRELD